MEFAAEIVVNLRPSVLDPAGTAVETSLHQMGYPSVKGLRIGKHVSLTVQATDAAAADAQVREMCDRLLANPVIETYQITLVPLAPHSPAVV